MTPNEALSFWFSRVDFERKPAKPGDLKLDRMIELLGRLGNPHEKLRIVHIAGSKGKGSTAAMFASVAQTAGLRTGLFTSPHLVDVTERIQINGQAITLDELARLLTEIRPAVKAMEATGEAPTFFEVGTALGFLHFAQQHVDLAIVEVGLGGRFDSTNVCQPILSIITSISYEHTDILGDKLSQIAFEKAGIIKPGRPVVSGVTSPEAAQVIRQIAAERETRLYELGTDFHIDHVPGRVSATGAITNAKLSIKMGGGDPRTFELSMLGAHQAANASLVVAGINILRDTGLAIDESAIRKGLANSRWPARMEVFAKPALVVLDCAHNVASAQALVDTLKESFPPGPRVLIFAASGDKDVRGIMAVFTDHFDHFVLTRFHNNPRSQLTDAMAQALRATDGNAHIIIADSRSAAIAEARRLHSTVIVIAGSVFLAGEMRPVLVDAEELAKQFGL